MKTLIRLIRVLIVALVAFVAVYVLAVVTLSRIPVNRSLPDKQATEPLTTIYVRTNGVHTDILMPITTHLRDWREVIPAADVHNENGHLPYMSFGWGDKGFYLDTPTWADLKASTAFIAATGLGRTAMHIEATAQPQVSESVRMLNINDQQLQAIIQHIDQSFSYDSKGSVMRINTTALYNDHDAFYEAEGRYSIFTTCNEWTRRGLSNAHIKTAAFSPLQDGIMRFLP
ncbi:TIGR02117 family protein [Hydromonas duriensis]|uniref:Uncharacterized protein (TIGR02117 family) n=1 Tax=Hydromonas duriensis TaxID=1527608 RepID=A0A4R6YA23_9BURK|nr:TIGR02117 family protein [Hydromonas duriensis]TDR32319.1 uncharacterized protein (TIGR02117 family) [Hydromonas duriensis]